MKKWINTAIFMLIVLLAAVLRFWQLGNVPASADWDEVALGYNAYSIMQTGRDEYGKFLPVILRSFDDYKPALYTYFVMPSIKVFGLNIFAVRLPSAVFGILTVIAVFFLVKELFKRTDLALVSSFLLGISPWHLQFSRIAFESNVGMAFNVFSALFFLKGLKRPWLLILSALFMGINLYVYQSEKVFVPLLALILVVIFRKQLFSIHKKYLAAAVILFLVISLPLVYSTLTNKEAFARAKGVSIFSDSTPLLAENATRLIEDKKNHDLVGVIFDNRRVTFAKSVISGYISHYDLNWLFISGDLARHHAPNMGLLYLWEFPFLLLGSYGLIFMSNGKFDKTAKMFILSWFLIAPIPASITSGVPHAVRTLNFLPMFQVLIAIGIISTLVKLSDIKYKILGMKIWKLFVICYLLFAILNFLYYLNQYFVQQNYFNSKEWQYGYKEAVAQVETIEKKYDKIIVSNKPHLDQSYMFFLFYLQYPPARYQAQIKNASGGFAENHYFGKYEFRTIEWEKERKDANILYVGLPEDFNPEAKVLKTINFLNGTPAIKIVEG